MPRARLRQFVATLLLLVGSGLIATACSGGSEDEGPSSVVQERAADGEAPSDAGEDVTDPDLSIDLDSPDFDPATFEGTDLGFLPDIEADCVAARVDEGASLELVATLNGCVSAESVAQILSDEGLELNPTEALCVFDARVEHEVAALEATTAVQAFDLMSVLQQDTVNCMTDATVADRITDVYPDLELNPDEARCALQVEMMEDEQVFAQTAWCGVAGRVLAADGLDISDEGVECLDELGRAALPTTTEELPALAADCVSDSDLDVITSTFG